MIMSRLSVFFALLIGCCSCGREASDAVVYEVSARKMEGLDDIFDFYGPFFFDKADSCLVKSGRTGQKMSSFGSIAVKAFLKNRIRRGRGPGEYLDLRVVGVNPATGDFQAVSSVGRSVVSFSREMVPLDTVTFGTALFDAVRAGISSCRTAIMRRPTITCFLFSIRSDRPLVVSENSPMTACRMRSG